MDNPGKMPKAKLPVLDDDGTLIPDSEQIRIYLEKKAGIDFDHGLTDEQRAISRAVTRMMEEHFYFIILCDRWLRDDGWAEIKSVFFSQIPFPLSLFLPALIRRSVIKQAIAQGAGRHSDEERLERAVLDLNAVEVLLGEKPFLFGDHPSSADISVVSMLNGLIAAPDQSPLCCEISKRGNLTDYLKRSRKAFYPSAEA